MFRLVRIACSLTSFISSLKCIQQLLSMRFQIDLITLLNLDLTPLLTTKRLYSIETMKLTLASLALGLSLATAFVIPQHGVKSSTVVLHSKVNSMWAFDVYGREDGQLPSQEIMYVEGDPWYFNPRSGLGQSDFYPRVGFFYNY